eukprot:SAG22_NODE_1475_length_4330_cov_2.543134_5_plen_87_part_00
MLLILSRSLPHQFCCLPFCVHDTLLTRAYHPSDELWYDNERSLRLKSEFARECGAGGVSMWNAGAIDYTNASQVSAFWGSFKPFTR